MPNPHGHHDHHDRHHGEWNGFDSRAGGGGAFHRQSMQYGNYDDDLVLVVIAVVLGAIWLYMSWRGRRNGGGWFGFLGFGKKTKSFKSVDELARAMRDAGLESAGLIIGVDFTRSNEWTGERSFGRRCMHDITGPGQNPYQEVLTAVEQALHPLNPGGELWCYGFGDEATRDEAVFCFMPGDRPCRDIGEALSRYRSVAQAARLSGPTSFAPLIRKAVELVQDSGNRYHCLVIIADGQVTKERETVEAIMEASAYPLSMIMVGVGDGPWDLARQFDDTLPRRRFDNFRFVEHRAAMGRRRWFPWAGRDANTTPPNSAMGFALHALAEVPEQYLAIRRLGLLDRPAAAARSRGGGAYGNDLGGEGPRLRGRGGRGDGGLWVPAEGVPAPSAPPAENPAAYDASVE